MFLTACCFVVAVAARLDGNIDLNVVGAHLFGVVDTLEVKRRDVGAVEGLPDVLFVTGEDPALQVCAHGVNLIPPAGGEKGRESSVNRTVGRRGGTPRSRRNGAADKSGGVETRNAER